jgi:RHS repeat-associated protein
VTNFYDAKSRRVRKVTPAAVTTFFYDGWNLIEERVAGTNGTVSTFRYYWGKDVSGELQGAGGVGGLLYLTFDDEIYIPLYDGGGNVTKYIDASGNIVASYTYGAFGQLLSKSGPLADVFRFRFSTKYYDAETGLYYYGYRFYSTALMRWLNRDPIEEKGGLNLYGFCGNNPVARYDKDGRAYFAVRRLGAFKNPIIFSGNLTFLNDWLDQKNMQPLHEQLFFQDGGSLISTGYGKENLDNEPMTGYVITSGGYDDCTMRIAVEKVNPQPYSLIKYNCQDYASQLRAKYYEIKDTEEVRCRCKKERR